MAKSADNSVELVIKPKELKRKIERLKALENEIANRNIGVNFHSAKGATIDEIVEASEMLSSIGDSFAEVVRKTNGIIEKTCDSFVGADNIRAAAHTEIGKKGQITNIKGN